MRGVLLEQVQKINKILQSLDMILYYEGDLSMEYSFLSVMKERLIILSEI